MKKLLRVLGKTLLSIICLIILMWAFQEVEMYFAKKYEINTSEPIKYPIENSDLTLFTNGHKLYKQLFTDIKQAKKEIHIYFFSIGTDQSSHQFLDLLKMKSDEGVPVYYAVDNFGGFLLSKKEEKDLKNHGVHFTFFNKPKPLFFFSSLNHRNHRRMTIIDGQIGYIGGFNIGKKYLGKSDGIKHWEDVQLRLEGSGVKGLEDQFIKDWRRNSKEAITPMLISDKKGKSAHQFVSYTKKGIEEQYVKLFKQAKNSISIYSPYFIPNNKKIWNALLDASKRGVDVKILYSKKSDALLVEQAAIPYVQQAMKNNITVYGYKHGIFHGKVIKIDQDILMIGTVNFDSRSFHLTDEINCYIYDKQFIKSVEPELDREYNHALKMTPDYFDNLPFKEKVKKKIAELVEFYL